MAEHSHVVEVIVLSQFFILKKYEVLICQRISRQEKRMLSIDEEIW